MKPGEIWDAFFPFGGSVGRKRRPVLILTGGLGPVPEVIVGYITGAAVTPALATDVVLDPMLPRFAATGLKMPSTLRLHKLASIHRLDLKSLRGRIDDQTLEQVRQLLRGIFQIP
jgi:mRNA interferase MazF